MAKEYIQKVQIESKDNRHRVVVTRGKKVEYASLWDNKPVTFLRAHNAIWCILFNNGKIV